MACARCQPAFQTSAGQSVVRRRARGKLAAAASLAAVRTFELGMSGAVAVAPGQRQPKGLVHFIGGAFVGAVPLPAYSLLLRRLADGGYTVVATSYAVTFQHVACAQAAHASFEEAVQELRSQPQGGWAAPSGLPVHGVGHSNGSLLHMLIGSLILPRQQGGGAGSGDASLAGSGASSASLTWQQQQRASNVLISYNNFRVSKAVPVPLSLVAPAVQQLRGPGGRLADSTEQALQQAAEVARQLMGLSGGAAGAAAGAAAWPVLLPQLVQGREQEQLLRSLQQLDPALVQLGSVFDEVGDGAQDFVPSPEEARQLISERYSVPDTLLVQFTNDDTDETPAAAAMLAPAGRGAGASMAAAAVAARQVSTLVLPGTHVTPCGADLPWQLPPGAAFGPAQALGMAAKAALQADTHRLADRILAYLDSRS